MGSYHERYLVDSKQVRSTIAAPSKANQAGSYLYTVLVVAVGESTASATRIANIYSFSSVVTGIALGFLIRKVRQLKIFIVIGVLLLYVDLICFVLAQPGSLYRAVWSLLDCSSSTELVIMHMQES